MNLRKEGQLHGRFDLNAIPPSEQACKFRLGLLFLHLLLQLVFAYPLLQSECYKYSLPLNSHAAWRGATL